MTDMTDLTIMFWTINNTYSYKVYTLDTKKKEGEEESGPEVESLFRSRNRDVREKVTDVIDHIEPDIVVLVEYSVGTRTVIKNEKKEDDPNPPENAEENHEPEPEKTDDDKSVEISDRFGPYIYRKNLNKKKKDNTNDKSSNDRWDAQLMSVECSDLSEEKKDGELEKDKNKTQSFELYCVLWKKSKVKPVRNLAMEFEGKKKSLQFQPRYPASMIFALKEKPQTKFTLVMFHAKHEKKDELNNSEIPSPIRDLSELKRINDAVNSSRKTPVILAGNFELDFKKESKPTKFQPLTDLGFKVHINDKTEFAKKENDENPAPTVRAASSEHSNNDEPAKLDLTRACDNILTVNFEEHNTTTGQEKPYDFIKEDCKNDVDEALTVSNHLPIYVTVRLK